MGTEQDLCPSVTGKSVEMTEVLGTSQGQALPPERRGAAGSPHRAAGTGVSETWPTS